MTSKSKKDRDIEDAATKNVIDYYKKYSQNPDLPKYFSGSPLSYLPKFKETDEEDDLPRIIIHTDFDVVVTTEEKNEPENISRASSAMSNKKLEWDNGADIGYDNCQKSQNLRKTCSLPIISNISKREQINVSEPNVLSKEISSFNIDEQDNEIKLFVLTNSDSESPTSLGNVPSSSKSSSSLDNKEEKKLISSSSSSSARIPEKKQSFSSDSSSQKNLSDFVNTLSYLKKKIGLPDAQSTPYIPESNEDSAQLITETPVVSNVEKRPKNVKILLDNYQKDEPNDSPKIQIESNNPLSEIPCGKMLTNKVKKSANLCLTKQVFVECISTPQKSPKKESIKQSVGIQTDPLMGKDLIQTVERHSVVTNQALEYCEHSDSDPNAASTQTGSDIIESNCSSFKYMKTCEDQKAYSAKSTNSNHLKKQKVEDTTPAVSYMEPSECSEDISISSNILSDDIEKNAIILQKLLKSKKYDSSTKRHYIKKILQRIVESKYLEESSNSSELFLPKKSTMGTKNLVVPPSTDSSSKSLQDRITLQSYSACSQCHKSSPKKRKQSSGAIGGTKVVPTKGEHKTTSNYKQKGQFIDINPMNKISSSEPSNISKSSSGKQCDSISSSQKSESKSLNYQNWKDDKTYSEQLFEANPSTIGDGDYFNLITNSQRERQINWIDQEIDHLGKLKSLLKVKEQKRQYSQINCQKVRSVYMVSDDNDHSEGQKSDGSKTKYVIETNLGTCSSRNRKYRVGDHNYIVQEISETSQGKNENNYLHPKITVGDIQVVSSTEGLNIKVTTFCEDCKKSPCVCTTSLNRDKFNSQLAIADKNLGTKSKTDGYSCCHKKTNSTRTVMSETSRHCPLCNLYNCNCFEKLSQQKDTYEGQFISCKPLSRSKGATLISEKQRSPTSFRRKFTVDFDLPAEKQSSSMSSSRKSSSTESEPPTTCTSCLKTTCQCASITEGGSLQRVFENCSCKSKSTCDCGFVSKLYKHFKPVNESKSENLKPVDNISIQTESRDIISTEVQTCSLGASEIIPPVQKELCSENVGVQCQVEMQHAGCQMSRDLISCASQTAAEIVQQGTIELEGKANENVQVSVPPKREQASQVDSKQFQSQYQQTEEETYRNENMNARNVEQTGEIPEDYMSYRNGDKTSAFSRKLSSEHSGTMSLKYDKEKPGRHKTTQSTPSMLNSVTSSTAISPYENSTSTATSLFSTAVCICCKKIRDKKEISIYRYDNEEYSLCSKCIKKKPILTTVCYTGPDYVCSCSQSEPETLKESQEYCSCIKPSQYKNTRYCAHCRFKLRRTLKSKNGIAYTLTLEYQSPRRHNKSKRKKPKELEEIKVKIPCPYSKKRHKDRENFDRRERMGPEISNDYTNDSTNRDSELIDSTNDEVRRSEYGTKDESQKMKGKRILTLQEHLMKNRPDFIDSAEYRRHALLNSRQDREIKKEEVKIRFLEENAKFSRNNGPKLFTEREMREITRKNYKKLPEVQQKLRNNREHVLRKADKFIVNTFTKKIQKSILKGRSTFPIDTNVVNVYK